MKNLNQRYDFEKLTFVLFLQESIALTILTWLQRDVEGRKKHANRLFNFVSWRRLPSPFLLKILLRHPLLGVDANIKSMVLDRIRRSYDDDDDIATSVDFSECETLPNISDSQTSNPIPLSSSYRNRRPRPVPHEAILLIGGLTLGEAERGDISQPNVMCYHPIERLWRHRAPWPERGLRGFSVSKFINNVVVTGVVSNQENLPLQKFNHFCLPLHFYYRVYMPYFSGSQLI